MAATGKYTNIAESPAATATCLYRLDKLPEDIILRVLHHAGDKAAEMRLAYVLGSVCRRLRTILISTYLPGLTRLDEPTLLPLARNDLRRARSALIAMLRRATAVRELHVPACSPVLFTSACFEQFAHSAGPQLRAVNLAYSQVCDESIRPLLRCPRLEELSLFSCAEITGEMFSGVDVRAPLLFLDLSFAHGLHLQGVANIAKIGTISELKLVGCEQVSTAAVELLAYGKISRSLQFIALNLCPVPDGALARLIENSPSLKTLTLAEHNGNLWETGLYTMNFIDMLNDRFPNTNIILES